MHWKINLKCVRIKHVERSLAEEKKVFEARIESAESAELESSGLTSRLEELKNQAETLQSQLANKSARLDKESDARSPLAERINKIPLLKHH